MAYQESAAAIENTVVYRFSKNELKELLQENHLVALDLVDYFTDNVSEIKDQLLQMAYSSVRKKTASTIIKFTEKIKINPKETIKISRSDLASVAGVATETFIRTLSELKREGLIDIEGRNIKIKNLNKLKLVH
jgi:CRP-like cAMP-binding protein